MKRFFGGVAALLLASHAMAADTWVQTENEGFSFALTLNQDGDAFGHACSVTSQMCEWIVVTESPCDEGDHYPALMSGKHSSLHIHLHCLSKLEAKGKKTLYRYRISPFDAIERMVAQGGIIGLVYALDTGRFKANRFN